LAQLAPLPQEVSFHTSWLLEPGLLMYTIGAPEFVSASSPLCVFELSRKQVCNGETSSLYKIHERTLKPFQFTISLNFAGKDAVKLDAEKFSTIPQQYRCASK
jgi:hypothetical protein